MAPKRKAQDAFGKTEGRLSAFAAAKLAKADASRPPTDLGNIDLPADASILVEDIANVPYDGHHSRATTPDALPAADNAPLQSSTIRPVTVLSTYRPNGGNTLLDDSAVEYTLQASETATFIGEFDLRVKAGVISIYGSFLTPSSGQHRVFAPSMHALPQLQARRDNTTILVSSVKSDVRKLEALSPLFRNVLEPNPNDGLSFTLLGTSQDDPLRRSLSGLEIDREIEATLAAIASNRVSGSPKVRIMAIGAKSSGKSTFNRILCNDIRNGSQKMKLQYLDLDPGQPEFGPPGQLSLVEVGAALLGPPFTHPASLKSVNFRLVRSHTIAATTFKDDPEHYKACVSDLVNYIDSQSSVVINACGWVTGVGATVLLELVNLLNVTDIVLLEPLEDMLVQSLRSRSDRVAFHKISRRVPKGSSRSPAETRAMQTMAYFHHKSGLHRWSGKPISKMRPWIVKYEGRGSGILAVLSYGQAPAPEFLTEVLDGSIVAIVVMDRSAKFDSIFRPANSNDGAHFHYITPKQTDTSNTVDPSISRCIGLALVRAIDMKKKQLHLVTPLPESEVEQLSKEQVVIVRGNFDPPEWAYLEDLYKGDLGSTIASNATKRPWVSRKDMVGIEGAVWRLRHPPTAAAVAAKR